MIAFAYWVLYVFGAIAVLMIVAAIIPSWRWAIYGNDDDGIYGDAAWRTNYRKRWWAFSWWSVAATWWARNPAHNLWWHALSRNCTHFWVWGHPELQFVQGWPQPPDKWLIAVYDRFLPQIAYVGDTSKSHMEFRAGFSRKEFTNLSEARWGFSIRWRKAS